ncbi:Surface polysaccharide O-acyltransferase, integral membrane enzyme [Sporobacter termitidis DSM 10068]|uniref:Surface polysaccharide O-acyltransferase, integral membrane enzyme n=1 Tax=Sporobacter termitidis DSM 10068 TaxID=1123282 RepID=A0A1M5TC50_9FIRM|nr:acyltransferase family protein [Sporobacter termitidis]SHH48385.1 Surface polysaccharide O-acyltransferase, integral membrane enzyme [Sporobacter termitidis DSM 10068]
MVKTEPQTSETDQALETERRISGIDIIKVVAIFSVICGHFLLNTKYYTSSVNDFSMYLQTFIRWFVYAAVPLFIICTGYLQSRAEISKKYFSKLIRILISYIVISILCILYKQFVLKADMTWQKILLSFTNFTADSYSWYVNMYIGLFLFSPFINLMLPYLNKNKRRFQLLLLLMFVFVSIPLTYEQVMLMFPNELVVQIPNYWAGPAYPILFYLIGAYLREFKPSVNRWISAGVIVLMMLVQSVIYIAGRHLLSPGNPWFISDYSSPFLLIESVGIVLLFYNISLKTGWLRTVFLKISAVTLEMYLFSFLVDSIVYAHIDRQLTQEAIFKKYVLIVVPLNILLSLAVSLLYRFLYDRISKLKAYHLRRG